MVKNVLQFLGTSDEFNSFQFRNASTRLLGQNLIELDLFHDLSPTHTSVLSSLWRPYRDHCKETLMKFLICYLMHTPKREQNCRPSNPLPNNGLFALHSCCAFRFLFWLFPHHIFQLPMCSLIVQIFLKFLLLV